MWSRRGVLAAGVLAALVPGWRLASRPTQSAPPPSPAALERAGVVLAQLPLMMAPHARRVLLVGWSGGPSAASALSHPVAAVEAFTDSGPPPPADPRLTLKREPAEPALARRGPSYDVVLIEGALTDPLVRLAAARLDDDGMLAARVALGPGPASLQDSLRVVLRHLPRATVWRVVEREAVVLASRAPPRGLAGLDKAFARPAASAWLRPLGLSYPATLLSLQALDEESTRRLAWAEPADESDLIGLDGRAAHLDGGLLLGRYLAERRRPLQPREYLEILLHPRSIEERPMFRGLLEEWVTRFPTDPRAVAFLYVVEEREGRAQRAALLRARLAALKKQKRPQRREIVVPGK